MVEYRHGTLEEGGGPTPGAPPEAWEAVMDEVERGGVVTLPYGGEPDLLSKRLAIGRRANKRGFKVEFDTGPDQMAVRRLPAGAVRPPAVEEPLRGHVDPHLRQEQAHAAALEEAAEGEATLGQMGGR